MQSLKEIQSKNIGSLKVDGTTTTLTGLSASVSGNTLSGLPTGHGIQVGDIIEITLPPSQLQLLQLRGYGYIVYQIYDNDTVDYIFSTDVVKAGIVGTWDLNINKDGSGDANVTFEITGGQTWAQVVTTINAALATASVDATAYFNNPPDVLWTGHDPQGTDRGILIRSNTFGFPSSITINAGTNNDFSNALSAANYSSGTTATNGVTYDAVINDGSFSFAVQSYTISGSYYNGSISVIYVVTPSVALLSFNSEVISPSLNTNGYVTGDTSVIVAPFPLTSPPGTSVHNVSGGGTITKTVSVANTNAVDFLGTPETVASVTDVDRIKKHYINNVGNIGIGTDNPTKPLDVQSDLWYKDNKVVKNNYNASTTPTVSNDSSEGYTVGSLWVRSGRVYACESANIGAANWVIQSAVLTVNGQSGDVNLNTDDVPELSNLYFNSTRFTNELNTKTTDNLTEGTTNKYFTTTNFNTELSGKTTDDLTEGTTNKYFNGKNTDGLSEGSTNKYVTQAQKNEFHTNHSNRTSLDLFQITSPQSNDILLYDSGLSKIVNTPQSQVLGSVSKVDTRKYTSPLGREFTNNYNNLMYMAPMSYIPHSGSTIFPFRRGISSTVTCFVDEQYTFMYNGSISFIEVKDPNSTFINATALGLSFTSKNHVIKMAEGLYIAGNTLIKLDGVKLYIQGSITLPSGTLVSVVKSIPTGSWRMIFIEGNGTASPVFKSYSTNFYTSSVVHEATVNYTSLSEYDPSYTIVTYTFDPQLITGTHNTSNNNSYHMQIAGTGWNGSQMYAWRNEIAFVANIFGIGTLTSSFLIGTDSGITINYCTFSGKDSIRGFLVARIPGNGIVIYNSDFSLSQSYSNPTNSGYAHQPIFFPTRLYPNGILYFGKSGSFLKVSYFNGDTLQEITSFGFSNEISISTVSDISHVSVEKDYVRLVAGSTEFILDTISLLLVPFTGYGEYSNSANQVISDSTTTTINIDTAVVSCYGITGPSSGILTLLDPGVFKIDYSATINSTTWAASSIIEVWIYVNDVQTKLLYGKAFGSASTEVHYINGSAKVKANRSDNIRLKIYQTSGGSITISNVADLVTISS